MDASAKERFIRVDVADAAHHSLVQEDGFYGGAAGSEAHGEIRQSDFERLRTQCGDAFRQLDAVLDAPELALVVVMQNAVVEREYGMGPFGGVRVDEKLAGHAEVDYQVAAIEADGDEFAVALDGFDAAADEGFGGFERRPAQDAQLEEFRVEDAPAYECGAQRADYGFDFGELRHAFRGGPEGRSLLRCEPGTWGFAGPE